MPTSPARIVVVGASAGGVEALQELVAELPADLGAPVLVVLHVPPTGTSLLPQILGRAGTLPVAHARDGEALRAARVYVAPPDLHLSVRDGQVELARGPRENGHRPAVDPLFRSAAASFHAATVGVILSGSRDDGTLGLAAIKHAGGVTIVQDPSEALYQGMPTSAIDRVGPDHVMRVAEIAALLATMAPGDDDGGGRPSRKGALVNPSDRPDGPEADPPAHPRGEVTAFTCPECRGTLWEVREGGLVRLQCRVGHAFTDDAYIAEKAAALEAALWTAVQTLQEKADFAHRLEARFAADGHANAARRYAAQRENTLAQAELVRRAVDALDNEAIGPEEERRAS